MPRHLADVQDRLSTLLGCAPEAREGVITSMLHRSPTESTGYWLGLVVSVAIATMGLVLGSAAVIIGAMLIAPLMSPIVGLGMGLAVGSPFLVLRSGARVLLSVTVAVSMSALLTRFLPFHELNQEITARTTPTILDLLTAGFCALAAVYASMRPGSDVTSTAAGTSIGISLVPPLCASGYGLGTGAWPVAGGAALLFLTNVVAIVAVGSLAFAGAGFNRVDLRAIEARELETSGAPISRALARRLEKLFATRSGPWLRLLMPLVLMLVVYFPLRRALHEVVWQISVRSEVRGAISRLAFRVVDSRMHVERGQVDVTLVLLGDTEDSASARNQLSTEIARATGVVPHLEVYAIPDAAAFAGLEATLVKPRIAVPSASERLAEARRSVQQTLERQWPERSAGALQSVTIATSGSPVEVVVVHVGPPLGSDARESIELGLTGVMEQKMTLVDIALPRDEIGITEGYRAFVARVATLAGGSRRTKNVWLCLTAPSVGPDAGAEESASPSSLRKDIEIVLDGHPRVVWQEAHEWSARVAIETCAQPADGGVIGADVAGSVADASAAADASPGN